MVLVLLAKLDLFLYFIGESTSCLILPLYVLGIIISGNTVRIALTKNVNYGQKRHWGIVILTKIDCPKNTRRVK